MKSLPTYAIRLAVLCILALATIQSFAQTDSIIQEDWVSTYSRQDSIQNIATAVHGSCIYVAGHTSAAPNGEDITIIRYSDLGDTLWVRHFNGAGNGNDRALAVTCDASGNVFVTGYVTAAGGDLDMILLKYSINGNLLWNVSYDNGGTDIALAIGADASNNIYIGGNSFGVNNDDFTVIKYDNNGVQQWVEKYDNGAVDQLVAMKVDPAGNSYATGTSDNGNDNDIATILVDPMGNTTWSVRYDALGTDDIARDIALDGNGNIYVTGLFDNSNDDMLLLSYSQSSVLQWERTFDGGLGEDEGHSIFAETGKVTVIASTQFSGTNRIAAINQYDDLGDLIWSQRIYKVIDNKQRVKIIGDDNGGYYVMFSAFNQGNFDYLVSAFTANGAERWLRLFNGANDDVDVAGDVSTDGNGNVFVTGQSYNGSAFDFATVKYSYEDLIIPPDLNGEPAGKNVVFTQNEGQIIDTDGNSRPDIKFRTYTTDPDVFVLDDFVSHLFTTMDTIHNDVDTLVRIDMTPFGETANVSEPFQFEEAEGVSNFYQAHVPKGRVGASGFHRIVYPERFDDIDMHIYSNANGLKYYFVVAPNGDPSGLQLEFTGQNSISVDGNGNLVLPTDIGTLTFVRPNAYQLDANNQIVPLSWQPSYSVGGNIVSFSINVYDPSLPLVFQMDRGAAGGGGGNENLDWSTYYGGSGAEEFHEIRATSTGTYVVGQQEAGNFPISNFFQGTNAGWKDAIILKFNGTSPAYSTYYGGADLEELDNCVSDVSGNLFVLGRTNSLTTFPTVDAGGISHFQSQQLCACPVCEDAFIGRLSPTGQLTWSTYLGGMCGVANVQTQSGGIFINSQGDIITVGLETSFSQYPTFDGGGGAYFSTTGGGFITVFDPNTLALVHSTLFDVQDIQDVHLDASDRLYITGIVNGSNVLPIVDPGGGAFMQPLYAGGLVDGFLARFDSDYSLRWSTYLGGDDRDFPHALTTDINDNLYVVGETESSNYLTQNGGGGTFFEPFFQGCGTAFSFARCDAVISKFDPNGVPLVSTYIGGTANEGAFNITVDANNTLYLVGSTGSDDLPFPSTTPNLWFSQPSLANAVDDQDDAMIYAFDQNIVHKWTTYFGGEEIDVMFSADALGATYLYTCGATNSQSTFPLQDFGSGYYQGTSGGFVDGFISRFAITSFLPTGFEEEIVDGAFSIYPNPTSSDLTISFVEQQKNVVIQVYDVSGKLLVERDLIGSSSQNVVYLNDMQLPSGMYMINIRTADFTKTAKFIVKD
jgi:hypothetical protein